MDIKMILTIGVAAATALVASARFSGKIEGQVFSNTSKIKVMDAELMSIAKDMGYVRGVVDSILDEVSK